MRNRWILLSVVAMIGRHRSAVFAAVSESAPAVDLKMDKESPAAAEFRAGMQQLVNRDLKGAEASFRKARQLAPKSPEPLIALADIELQEGQPIRRRVAVATGTATGARQCGGPRCDWVVYTAAGAI